ncbi:MAG: C4-dicarboxylate TRAP transporter substrate-binding protein [Acetobacteraceae bacterium]
MKHVASWILGTALAGAMLAGTAGGAAAETLKAAHFLSPKHPVGVGYQVFADEVKRASNGKLTVRIFPGESLLGAKAISDGVRDHVADMGQVVMTYTPSYYPHGVMINNLAMVGEDDMAGAMTVTELYWLHCKPCHQEFSRQNQIFLGGTSTVPYVIIAKGDLNGVDKIKGAKLRAGGSLWDRFAAHIGAVGVNIAASEMYESLSRGILNGALYAVGGLKTHGLGDVATQVVMLKTGSFRAAAVFSVNQDTWSKLSPEQRVAMFKASSLAVVRTVEEYRRGDEEGIAIAKQKNIPLVEPDPALVKARDDFVAHDLERTVANAKQSLGIDDAADFVEKYKTLYAKYDKLVQPVAKDTAKLAEILYQETYAKLDPKTAGVKQ